jgi:hypothetical protein
MRNFAEELMINTLNSLYAGSIALQDEVCF